ncbi:MAG: hypothetical protein QNL55_08450 [Euryarchaeota archaeon]
MASPQLAPLSPPPFDPEVARLEEEVRVASERIQKLRVDMQGAIEDKHIAGVDLLESDQGPLVLEVNSSPGLEGIEKASGVNVAGEIIDFVTSEASFSKVDLDQLMRTVPGQGMVSLQIRNHPNLVGEKLCDLFKTSVDVPVFALSRDNSLLWNPDSELQLRYADVLICYGELTELRSSLRQAIGEIPSENVAEVEQES